MGESTKVYKSDYTNRGMKQKGVYEAHELTKEHGYLGEARKHLENGHIPGGKLQSVEEGTSKLSNGVKYKDGSAGNVSKGKDTKYK